MFWFSLQYLSKIFFILRRIQKDFVINIHICLHVKSPLFCHNLIKFLFYRRIFGKPLNIKFHYNSSNGSRVVSMRTERQTDMTMLIAAFHNFSNAPKDYILCKFLLRSFLQRSFTSFSMVLPIFRTTIS